MKPALIAAALLVLSTTSTFAFGFKSRVAKLPVHQLAEYEAQSPALITAAQQAVGTDGTGKKVFSKTVVLAPSVHSYSYESPEKKGYHRIFTDYWRFSGKGVTAVHSDQAYHALQNVQDWTYHYVTEGLKARRYNLVPAQDAIKKLPAFAKAGKAPASVHTDKAAITRFGSYTYSYPPDANDWSTVPFSDYAGIRDFDGVVLIHGADRWQDLGEAQLNGEAIVVYAVHHTFRVNVCSADQTCKAVRVPKEGGPDLVTRNFIPSLKSVDDDKRKANNTAAIRLAARHNADIILVALDAAMEKAP